METIADLNKKVLYRIAKVIFFGALLSCIALPLSEIYDANIEYPYNEDFSRITCINGYSTEIAKSTYGISGDELTLAQKKAIGSEICGMDTAVVDSYEYANEFKLLLTDNPVFKASKGVMEHKLDTWPFVGSVIAALLAIFAAFEVLRRIFYYIVLGTFRPKKS